MGRRVALISSSFDPYVGGVEEHVRHVASELRARGDDVVVWTVDRGEHLGTREVDGIEVRHLPTPLPSRNIGPAARFALSAPAAWREWMRAWRDFRPDVLHVQCFGPNGLYALALHRRTGVPLVVSSHGETFADDHGAFEGSALLRRGLVSAIGSASAVTGCSTVVRDDLVQHFGVADPSRVAIVPNGVRLETGDDAPGASGAGGLLASALPWWPEATSVVLGLGRLEHLKGFDLLVRAFARVRRPGECLVIGGDGSELQSLRELASALGMAEHVHLPGRLSGAEVVAATGAAALVAVPSRREAFGIVALEAWRARTPLVMTCRGGAADFMSDGVEALLVDPEDVGALGAALRRVLDDENLARRLSAAGHEAVQGFAWGRVAEAYQRAYGVAPA